MSTNVVKPLKVAIIGASGTYGRGILARAEELGVEAVMVTRSPHKHRDASATTTVVETQLDEEEKLQEVFAGCDGAARQLRSSAREEGRWTIDEIDRAACGEIHAGLL